MTREEYEFMRNARGTLRTVAVTGPAVELIGSSPYRIAVLLFPSVDGNYEVGDGPQGTTWFAVPSGGVPVELLLEKVGDLVQQPLWVRSSGAVTVAFVETVVR
jgi:hypothetical protein